MAGEDRGQRAESRFDFFFALLFLFLFGLQALDLDLRSGSGEQGALKKKSDGPLRIFDYLSRNQPTPKYDFSSLFFLVRFWAFLGEGSSKTR